MIWIRLVRYHFGTVIFRVYARVVHGLRFQMAASTRENDLYRLRFRLYCEEGYIRAHDYPEEMFSDKYDQFSVSVIAEKDGEIIGAGRVTRHSELGLPTLDYFNLQLAADMEPASLAEMGRFMIDRRYRGKSRIVSVGLSTQLRSYIREDRSIKWLIAFMSTRVRQAFSSFVPFEPLDEGPLGSKHLAAREMLPGYWAKGDIHPVAARSTALL